MPSADKQGRVDETDWDRASDAAEQRGVYIVSLIPRTPPSAPPYTGSVTYSAGTLPSTSCWRSTTPLFGQLARIT
jgi:hypothetical protein